MTDRLQEVRIEMDSLLERWRMAREVTRNEAQALRQSKASVEYAEEAQRIVQEIAQRVQQIAHDHIARVVSKCLETIFDEPYKFILNFERKRGRTEANLIFERDGESVDPLSASGGGVVDVAAFALRLSCLILSKPPLRRFLALDEPFKFVAKLGPEGEEYRERIRQLLEELSKELDVQFLMVTHMDELETGHIVRL